jgi:hypothetical protein
MGAMLRETTWGYSFPLLLACVCTWMYVVLLSATLLVPGLCLPL